MTPRRALVIGHDHVAGLGALEPALTDLGFAVEWFRVVPPARFDDPDVDVTFPDPRCRDLVITLGAPWPRDRIRTWAAAERAFLRRAHDAAVPILAICFGAQLLAEAHGGGTRPLRTPRIGWYPVSTGEVVASTGRAAEATKAIEHGPWFCWNAEQLVPPPAAQVLAANTDGCAAFRVGTSVGLQFHPEMTTTLLRAWLTLGAPPDLDVERLRQDTVLHEQRAALDAGRLLSIVL